MSKKLFTDNFIQHLQFPKEEKSHDLPKNLISIDSFSYSLKKFNNESSLIQMIPILTSSYDLHERSINNKSSKLNINNNTTKPTINNNSINNNTNNSSNTNSNSSFKSQTLVDFNHLARRNQATTANTTTTTTQSQIQEKYTQKINSPLTLKPKNSNNLNSGNVNYLNINESFDPEDEYLRSKIINYKNNLSKLIKNRYTSEPFIEQQKKPSLTKSATTLNSSKSRFNYNSNSIASLNNSKPNSSGMLRTSNTFNSNTSTTNQLNKAPNVVVYADHIDNLTAELIAKLSNGIDKNLLGTETSSNANTNKDKTSQKSFNNNEKNLDENLDYDNNYEDEPDNNSSEFFTEDDDDYYEEDVFDNIIDYEDERIILGTNINEDSSYFQNVNNLKNNLVMRICNEIKSYEINDEETEKQKYDQKYRSKYSRKLRNLKNMRASKMTQESTLETQRNLEYPANYFDKEVKDISSYNEEFEYEYTEIMIDDFRKVLDRYDGSMTADAFIKQQLPSPEQITNILKQQKKKEQKRGSNNRGDEDDIDDDKSSNHDNKENDETNEDKDKDKEETKDEKPKTKDIKLTPEKAVEMYNILKRMLVKKKYVMATVKQEKEAFTKKSKFKRNGNSNSSFKSRPSTGLTSNTEYFNTVQLQQQQMQHQFKMGRPKTVNIIPIKQTNSTNFDDENDSNTLIITDQPLNENDYDFGEMNNQMSTNVMGGENNGCEEEFYYEPFRLSPTTLNTQTWPFEVDFEKFNKPVVQKKQPQPPSKNKNGKCYTCKKLPVVKNEDNLNSTNINQQLNVNKLQSNQKQQNQSTVSRLKLSSIPVKLKKSDTEPEQSVTIGTTATLSLNTSSTTLLNPTYNSASRCVSAKIQTPTNPTDFKSMTPSSRANLSSAKTIKSVIDVVDFNRNNFSNDFDIDKEILDEDDINTKKNLIVNKEEHLRKMNILPGKTFRSQRRKSISIDHVPISKKKIETQKAKIPLIAQNTNRSSGNNNIQNQNKHFNYQKKQNNNNNKSFNSKSSSNLDSSSKKNIALAMQHHEEIYSLINKKPNDRSTNLKNKSCIFNFSSDNNNYNAKGDLTTLVYKKTNKLSMRNKRPKTSKV